MMMMCAPNSLVCQKEGVQEEEEEEEAGGRGKAGPTKTLTPGADAPMAQTRSGVLDARNRRKHGRCCGVPLHRRGRGNLLLGISPILSRWEWRELQKDERSCESVVL